MTQLELALAAGVSERTLRSAEKGRSLHAAFLQYIAGALGVPFQEIIAPHRALSMRRWEDKVSRVMTEVQRSMHEHDTSGMLDIIHRSLEMKFQGGIPGVPSADLLVGDYRGADGVKQFIDNNSEFWEHCPQARVVIEPPAGGGNVVIFRGRQEHAHQDGALVWGRWSFICEFEDDRLIRIDNFLAPSCAPPELATASAASM